MELTLKHHKYLKTISRSWTPNLLFPNLNAIMERPHLRRVKVGWGCWCWLTLTTKHLKNLKFYILIISFGNSQLFLGVLSNSPKWSPKYIGVRKIDIIKH